MGVNRYEAESKLRRIATKLLVTAITNGYNSGSFSLQNNQVKLLNARTITESARLLFYTHFLNRFFRPFDDHNNQHSPQQGVGKFDNENAQTMCRVGCSNIKYV